VRLIFEGFEAHAGLVGDHLSRAEPLSCTDAAPRARRWCSVPPPPSIFERRQLPPPERDPTLRAPGSPCCGSSPVRNGNRAASLAANTAPPHCTAERRIRSQRPPSRRSSATHTKPRNPPGWVSSGAPSVTRSV
jgi:hypothetical protein